MNKGEVSCAVGPGSDGTGAATLDWAKIVALSPTGVRIYRWNCSGGPEKGHLGKIVEQLISLRSDQ